MRLFKISQSIIFNENSDSGIFKKGQEVTFSGYIKVVNEIVTGYMIQEPKGCSNIVLYLKGYWAGRFIPYSEDLVLFATTKCSSKFHLTMCSYFSFINSKGISDGFLSETDGVPSKKGKYFFIEGDYTAKTQLYVSSIPSTIEDMPNLSYLKAKKKMNKMLNRFYLAKKQENLQFGHLIDLFKPYWAGPYFRLIHICPECPKKPT